MGPRSCGVEKDFERCLPASVLDALPFFLFGSGAPDAEGALARADVRCSLGAETA